MTEEVIILSEHDIAEALEEILCNLPPMNVQQQMVEMVKQMTEKGISEAEATDLVFDKLSKPT